MVWLKSWLNKGHRFLQLSKTERWLLLQAFLLLPIVGLSLRLFGLQQTQRFLSNGRLQIPASIMQDRKARSIAQMVSIAAHLRIRSSSCLTKSIVLWYLLQRYGIECTLMIGVRRQHGIFEAHAWVDYHGIVLNDSHEVRQQYSVFDHQIKPTK